MQCPQRILLQVPRYGKQFIKRVKPTLTFDITVLCEGYGKLSM